MNAVVGWSLAVVAVAVGYAFHGWPGVALALTIVVFWLLLQFSRALRAMRAAAGRPVGSIDSALMLHAQLHPGMRLLQILPLTRSLGLKVADDPETFVWTDGGGDRVRVQLHRGRTRAFTLERSTAPGAQNEPATPAAPPGAA